MDAETQALMKDLAEDAATRAVNHTLIMLGIDSDDPIEAQRDMAALRELRVLVEDNEFRKDLMHLRTWRTTMDGVSKKGWVAGMGFIALGGIALIIYALRLKVFGL